MIRRRTLLPLPALLACVVLSSCGALQTPAGARDLDLARGFRGYPVFWVGPYFLGYELRQVTRDPSDAFELQYGGCVNGRSDCTAALTVITTGDPTFVPGGPYPGGPSLRLRGVPIYLALGGAIAHVPIGRSMVTIDARSRADALAAVKRLRSINFTVGNGPGPLPHPAPRLGAYGVTPGP